MSKRQSTTTPFPTQTLQHGHVQDAKGGLGYVLNRAKELLVIESLIHETIAGNQNSVQSQINGLSSTNVKVASLEKGILHIITTSGVIATRIKYSQANLIALLKRQNRPFFISSIKVSVQPEVAKPKLNTKPAIPPSQTNAKLLEDTAQYIEDQPLREALIKLSLRSTGNKSTD